MTDDDRTKEITVSITVVERENGKVIGPIESTRITSEPYAAAHDLAEIYSLCHTFMEAAHQAGFDVRDLDLARYEIMSLEPKRWPKRGR